MLTSLDFVIDPLAESPSVIKIVESNLLSFFNSETGTHNFQSEKAIDSITSGGFFGKGIGEGTLKNRVPEAHTDYVLASISEEYGIVAIIIILIIIFSLFMRVFAICQNEISNFKKYTLIALSTLILLQIFINVGVTINLLPSTGMTFSFLSYGGSSILTRAFIMGIILALTKNKL